MLKKSVLLIICAALVLVPGCAAIIEGEYSSSSNHKPSYSQSLQEAEMSVEVSSYQELYDSILTFITEGIEYGAVRFEAYDGDIESDLSEACLSVANTTPLGAYAVYYINYSLNKIVSYYEADVSVIYKKTSEEIDKIIELENADMLDEQLKNALETRASKVTFLVKNGQIGADMVNEALERVYYENPDTTLYYPECSISFYPESSYTYSYTYIMELSLTFPYTTAIVKDRLEEIKAASDEVISEIDAGDIYGQVEQISAYLSENVQYDEKLATSGSYSRWYNSFTAYGALVLNKAVGEGYAMTMKFLCNELGIECLVIRGRFNNINHAWNLIKLDSGEYYHVDSSQYEKGGRLFFNDSQMRETYWWDIAAYPECSGEAIDDMDDGNIRPEGESKTYPTGMDYVTGDFEKAVQDE